VSGGAGADAPETPSLATLYRQERLTPAPVTLSDSSRVSSTGWVLIDGILGEFSGSLYQHVLPVLRDEAGVMDVEVIRPSSYESMDANADRLAESLRKNFQRGKRPLVILAHSRGAAETHLALLRHPDLIESGVIDSAVLVQGAFHGSPLASFVEDRVGGILGPFRDSVRTLTPDEATRLHLDARRKLSREQRMRIASKVFFVRGRAQGSTVRAALRSGGLYLDLFHGENDGVLLTTQQKVAGLGRDLGILDADHFELLGSTTKATDSEPAEAAPRAFTRALLRVL
jgi:pimeloyl-ACP methyl ester carboxylesterase